jgi:hypothetical protein
MTNGIIINFNKGDRMRQPDDWTEAEANEAQMSNRINDLECALKSVHSLISEAAKTGFNCHEGDWAERLFYSQRETSDALKSN